MSLIKLNHQKVISFHYRLAESTNQVVIFQRQNTEIVNKVPRTEFHGPILRELRKPINKNAIELRLFSLHDIHNEFTSAEI